MKSIRAELARLRERALARRDAREDRCICELVFIAGEPTPAQVAIIARNAECPADHTDKGFTVVTVPPMPEWMQRGEPPPPRAVDE